MVFDVLMVQGESVMHLSLKTRRQMLEDIVGMLHDQEPAFQLIDQFEATAENVQSFLDSGFEGAMLKRRKSPYLPGKRLSDWQKIKRMSTGDFFIIGSVDGRGRNEGKVGSFKVAYLDDDGIPVYCADVAGITDSFRDEATGPDGKIAPEWLGRVIEVMGQGRTKNGRIRHPNFVRLRPDKSRTDCTTDCSIDLFEDV
jgi:bifunctional non-homologous end joining protein LigD